MKRLGLSDRVEIKFQDYRDEVGLYDKIASIEMFEAVGERFWPTFFGKVRACLKPGGLAGFQIITINDNDFDYYRAKPDFIQRYIFPGGMLPSPSALASVTRDSGLLPAALKVFPQDYARTLAEWRERFHAAWPRIEPMGFDTRFRRLWEFYLHYCEAGFRSEYIDVRQVVYARA
jgi:cyclopropane-fatty-acyl-phospholipid synthase